MHAYESVRLLALAGALSLAGCASTAGGCVSTDWYQQGYADGSRTWHSLLDKHIEKCAAFGVKPDADQYNKGWNDGCFAREHRFTGG